MKYTELIADAVNTIILTIKNIISTDTGFIASLLPVIALAFTANNVALFCLVAAMSLDAIWGVIVSVKYHDFSISGLIKKTLIKIGMYGSVILIIFLLERGLNSQWYLTSRIVISLAAGAELFSLLANMSIICPNALFLKLLRKALISEISNKLGISKHEVEKFLIESKSKNCTHEKLKRNIKNNSKSIQ